MWTVSTFCYAQFSHMRENDKLVLTIVKTKSGYIEVGPSHEKKEVGDFIIANQQIHWSNQSQAIKLRSIRTKIEYEFCAKEFNDGAKNLYSRFVRRNHSDHKGTNDMMEVLGHIWYMMNDIRIVSSLKQNNNCFYTAKTIPGDKEFVLQYDDETNEIFISKKYLRDQGVNVNTPQIRLHIEYYKGGKSFPITDNMIIEFVPSNK